MNPLSNRVQNIKPSPTLAASMRAAELIAQGKDIISLTAGEPDFDTPAHIGQAAIDAIRHGDTRYTNVDGTPALKTAIIQKLKRENHLDYTADQLIVSNGAKQSIFNLLQAMINPGDEMIILAPYWVSYPDMTLVCDGTPVLLSSSYDQGFKVSPAQIEAAITPKTKLIMLNSPGNPSGMVYTAAELNAIGNILERHPHVYIVSDDIYERVYWASEPFCNIVNTNPNLKERTIVINGVSKSYAMTGWRIGYAAGPKNIIKAMKTLQSQSTSNPCSISQAAAVAALAGDQSCLDPMIKAFKERHDLVYKAFNQMKDVRCLPAQGAFYAFPDMSRVMKRLTIKNDLDLTDLLLEHGVAVVPGSAFGVPDTIRISYATSNELLVKALQRIETAIA